MRVEKRFCSLICSFSGANWRYAVSGSEWQTEQETYCKETSDTSFRVLIVTETGISHCNGIKINMFSTMKVYLSRRTYSAQTNAFGEQ